MTQPTGHIPVMLPEVLTYLSPKPGQTLFDATAGCGGYAEAIRERLGGRGLVLAADRDPQMARVTRDRLGSGFGAPFRVFEGLFSQVEDVLAEADVRKVDGLVADLGVASPQIDQPDRGFSYRHDGPLSMKMSPEGDLSADVIVNHWPEKSLADVIYRYGEERFSRRIARSICRRRREAPIRSTAELAEIIRRAMPQGPRKHHPARKSFQAIRVACNREIEELEALVETLPRVLAQDGRAVIVSYHSLEDRVVKQAFTKGAKSEVYEVLTRRVVRPSAEETAANPRSRSARLRAVRCIRGVRS